MMAPRHARSQTACARAAGTMIAAARMTRWAAGSFLLVGICPSFGPPKGGPTSRSLPCFEIDFEFVAAANRHRRGRGRELRQHGRIEPVAGLNAGKRRDQVVAGWNVREEIAPIL